MQYVFWVLFGCTLRCYCFIDNRKTAEQYQSDTVWALDNVPLFECADVDITTAYSFRWRVYRKHIVYVPEEQGYVVTEFVPPVSWAGPYNTIAGSASHHILEGRWLRRSEIIDDYSSFWFGGKGMPRAYTAWLATAIYARALVDGRFRLPVELLQDLQSNFEAWNRTHWVSSAGCFFQSDTWDGGEDSISGDGCRVSINSVMYGELVALASIQELANLTTEAVITRAKAEAFQRHILELLWHERLEFFCGLKVPFAFKEEIGKKVGRPVNSRCPGAPEWPVAELVPVRELLALATPFYFGVIPVHDTNPAGRKIRDYSRLWDHLVEADGFAAEWGPRTAERRHPAYNFSCEHACTWNGPSWPYETSRLLTGLANFLNDFPKTGKMTSSVWLQHLAQYARAQTRARVTKPADESGRQVPPHPWIGENLHPDDGYWLARDYMFRHDEWDKNRGYMYNHATYCDLVITGLVGIRPRQDDILEVNPLIDGKLEYFALENVLYHDHEVSIVWDSDGAHYNSGHGLQVWVDGKLAAKSPVIQKLHIQLPKQRIPWTGE